MQHSHPHGPGAAVRVGVIVGHLVLELSDECQVGVELSERLQHLLPLAELGDTEVLHTSFARLRNRW